MSFAKIDKLVSEILFSKQIDTTKWKYFPMTDVFKDFVKGTVAGWKHLPKGEINIVTTSSKNNGVSKKVQCNKYFEKMITLANNADGFMFWQEEPFNICTDCCLCINDKLNKYSGLFICCVWNSLVKAKGYGWDNKTGITKVKKETILLPQDANGNPDYNFMEQYVKERERDCHQFNESKIDNISNDITFSEDINLEKWQEFNLVSEWKTSKKSREINNDGIFVLSATLSGLDNNKIINTSPEIYPLISRTNKNNGIVKSIGKQNKPFDAGNCLTIGLDTQTVFWQDKEFYTGQNINILRNDKLNNKFISLFIASILTKAIKEDFQWGSQGATLGRLAKYKIMLPSKNNQPDWEFMEKYAKSRYQYFMNKLI